MHRPFSSGQLLLLVVVTTKFISANSLAGIPSHTLRVHQPTTATDSQVSVDYTSSQLLFPLAAALTICLGVRLLMAVFYFNKPKAKNFYNKKLLQHKHKYCIQAKY